VAQQAAHLAARVVVVNMQLSSAFLFRSRLARAQGAVSALRREQPLVLIVRDA
jgi:hypothetical protein